jgi:hypothetical protein
VLNGDLIGNLISLTFLDNTNLDHISAKGMQNILNSKRPARPSIGYPRSR